MNETDVLREIRELIAKWREKSREQEHVYDSHLRDCADELEKLLPGLQEAWRERMKCGHPSACWMNRLVRDNVAGMWVPMGGYCTACRQQELAVHTAKADAWDDAEKIASNHDPIELLHMEEIFRRHAAAERKLSGVLIVGKSGR